MCETLDTDAEITRSENGRALIVTNAPRWQVGVVEVDGCLINDNSKRCDWMVRLPLSKKISKGIASSKLIELKGSNVLKAFQQLEATLIHPAVANDRVSINECFIVSKISPSFTGTIQIQKKYFRDQFGLPVNVVPVAKINVQKP